MEFGILYDGCAIGVGYVEVAGLERWPWATGERGNWDPMGVFFVPFLFTVGGVCVDAEKGWAPGLVWGAGTWRP